MVNYEEQITSGVGDLLHVQLELLLEPLDGVVKVLYLLPQVEVLAGQPAGRVSKTVRRGRLTGMVKGWSLMGQEEGI